MTEHKWADAAGDVEPVAWRLDYPPDAGVGLPRFFGADAKPRLANFTSNYNAKQVALYSAATVAALQSQVEALRIDAQAEQSSRGMFIARLENAQQQGHSFTASDVLGLLNDCDYMASLERDAAIAAGGKT